MKKIILILAALCIMGQLQAVDYFKGTYTEALKKAKEENKNIFLFFTASWCGPCNWMKQNILADSAISDYIDTHYIPMMLDFDIPANKTLYARYFDDGGAIPKFLIINAREEVLRRLGGAVKQKKFAEFIMQRDDSISVGKIEEVPAALKTVKVNRGVGRLIHSLQFSRVKPGIQLGADFSNFHTSPSGGASDYRSGYHIGLTTLIQMTKHFYIQPGLSFSSQGAKNKDEDVALRLNYTELSLNLGRDLFRYGFSSNHIRLNLIPYGAVAVAGK